MIRLMVLIPNWKAWLRRSFKNEHDANRVLQPLPELEGELEEHIGALSGIENSKLAY